MTDLSRLSKNKLFLECCTQITKCRLDAYSAPDQSLASYIQREAVYLEDLFARVSIPQATYEDIGYDSKLFTLS